MTLRSERKTTVSHDIAGWVRRRESRLHVARVIGAAALVLASVGIAAPAASAAVPALARTGSGSSITHTRYLWADSCTSPTACIAVGYDTNSAGTVGVTLAERWNGTRWKVQATPNPAGATNSWLFGVSCTSPTACIAVGSYNGNAATLAEVWNGTTWQIQATPKLTGGFGILNGVSCSSPTACTAVGMDFSIKANKYVTLAEAWDGTKWKIQSTPSSVSGQLYSVSCTSSTACTAVGVYTNSSGVNVALAEAWNGTKWKIQSIPNPTGTVDFYIWGVSCTSSTACVAVGSNFTTASSEVWNGTTWTVRATAIPAGGTGIFLGGVSCTSATACTAVGFYTDSSNNSVTLAEMWNGAAWTIQATPNATGGTASNLNEVSCSAPTACTGVGGYANSSNNVMTLAEAWNGTKWKIHATP